MRNRRPAGVPEQPFSRPYDGIPACSPSVLNRLPSNLQKSAVRQRKSPLCHPHKEASNKSPILLIRP
ncbi:hypothetical protein Barb6XT_01672 [Bacteroidales bacterium Barb6XT]|nr:hypothetical protein Barb6XT_01672 [Bacteroidales bacterium Barb6XT]